MLSIRKSKFFVLSIDLVLLGIMIGHVGYEYYIISCSDIFFTSAPPWVAFFMAIPYLLLIGIITLFEYVITKFNNSI